MKKLLFVLLVLSLLVLSACGGEKVMKEEPVAEEPVVEKEVQPIVEKETKPAEPVDCMDPEIKDLIAKADTDQLHYYMRETPYFRQQYEVFVKGDKMKIILPEATKFIRGEYFDTVYLDLSTKDAVAYCEDPKRCDDSEEEFAVEYDEYYRLTPMDWAMSLNCADEISTENMFDRDVMLVEYTLNGKTANMWLYMFNGVTAQMIEDIDASEPVQRSFEILSLKVDEEDVTKQFA
ncbi:hypothetical protein KY336_02920 [Candidatus Woesearchaeota archaeon]|nr:hypothetical protein [Candidatus Woesearchaeota archaeon]